MDNLVGQRIDKYQVLDRLGGGGMATVYQAVGPDDTPVAIKVLFPHQAHNPQFAVRFRREARMARALRHPHIVRVYDSGKAQGLSYIVMEYVPGGTLHDLLAQGVLPMAQIVLLVSQIASALTYAHEKGIVHRDVKPSNVLLASPQESKLSDFGIARLTQAEGKGVVLTNSDMRMGTPAYSAPEQARNAAKADHRADVYALGVIIYEMIAGIRPYDATTPVELALQHITKPTPPLRQDAPGAPESLERILFKALAKEPDERFSSAQELAAVLADAVAGRPVYVELPSCAAQAIDNDATMPDNGPAFTFAHSMDHAETSLSAVTPDPEQLPAVDDEDDTDLVLDMTPDHQAMFKVALNSHHAGDRNTAYRLVLRILEEDETAAEAWLLRSYLEENWHDQLQCAKNALAVAPDSEDAQLRLKNLQAERLPDLYMARTTSDIPPVRAARDKEMAEYFQESTLDSAVDPLDDPAQCPYCGVVNSLDRNRCSACRHSLLQTRHPVKRASAPLRMARSLTFAAMVMVVAQLLPVGLRIAYRMAASEGITRRVMDILLGQPLVTFIVGDFAMTLSDDVLAFLAVLAAIRLGLLVLVLLGLQVRTVWGYYLGLGVFVGELLLALSFLMIDWTSLVITVLTVAAAVAGILAISGATVNFPVRKERIIVRPDIKLKSGKEYWRLGRAYQRQEMWAMAVVHYRAAVAAAPNVPEHYKALGIGYNELGRTDRSLRILEQALRLDPTDLDTATLIKQLRQRLDAE